VLARDFANVSNDLWSAARIGTNPFREGTSTHCCSSLFSAKSYHCFRGDLRLARPRNNCGATDVQRQSAAWRCRRNSGWPKSGCWAVLELGAAAAGGRLDAAARRPNFFGGVR
jgi:hypothetical protein